MNPEGKLQETDRFKFRTWDGERFIYFDTFEISFEDKKPYVRFKNDTFNGHLMFCQYEMMQYTGMKDRNGKEIYEGDIVLATLDKKRFDLKRKVGWLNGSFILIDVADDQFWSYLFQYHDIEIIGNIFED